MRKVIVNEWMSFDGLFSRPVLTMTPAMVSRTAAGTFPYFDQTSQQWVADGSRRRGFLFSRRAYELQADAADAVRTLKKEDGGDLHLIGSTQLAQTLLNDDLVECSCFGGFVGQSFVQVRIDGQPVV